MRFELTQRENFVFFLNILMSKDPKNKTRREGRKVDDMTKVEGNTKCLFVCGCVYNYELH